VTTLDGEVDAGADRTANGAIEGATDTRLGTVWSRARHLGILGPFLVLFLVLAVTSRPFLSTTNLLNLFDQQATILVVAAVSTLVLIAGGVDLSVGAVYALSGLIAAKLSGHMDPYLAMLIAVLCGLVIGAVNGLLVTVARINALIATLAMSYAVAGLATITAGGTVLIVSDPRFLQLGSADLGPIKLTSILALLVIAVSWILLSAGRYGRSLYAVGGNEAAARLAGIRTWSVKLTAYALSGAAAALGGVMIASRVGSGQADAGIQTSLVFTVLAGIVIGGTSLLGGEGAIWRTCIGILFLALINNGFVLLSLDSVYEQIIEGLLIVLAVGSDSWRRSRRS
jgi:ribose transport system permease protein